MAKGDVKGWQKIGRGLRRFEGLGIGGGNEKVGGQQEKSWGSVSLWVSLWETESQNGLG